MCEVDTNSFTLVILWSIMVLSQYSIFVILQSFRVITREIFSITIDLIIILPN